MTRQDLTMRGMLPTAVVCLLMASAASAAPFTADWRVVPHVSEPDLPAPSPYYDCDFWGAGGLICSWLWDQGLEVRSQTGLPLYSDVFYDAIGTVLPLESEITGADELLSIEASCRSGLHPCFDMFTPRDLSVGSYSQFLPAGVFFTSSRGGLVTVPKATTVSFSGAEWTDIAWLGIGLFLPDACADPASELRCDQGGELDLDIAELRFDATPVPEPATALLLGAGLIAALRRRRCG